jgi:hypothetical protein
MLKYVINKGVGLSDWNEFVSSTYGRIYDFQQQEGCRDRGIFSFSVPSKYTDDKRMHESIPEIVNGEKMGVKFKTWLERDPNKPIENQEYNSQREMFWQRNFYPDIYTLVNDLYEKGLLEEGDYTINIDW